MYAALMFCNPKDVYLCTPLYMYVTLVFCTPLGMNPNHRPGVLHPLECVLQHHVYMAKVYCIHPGVCNPMTLSTYPRMEWVKTGTVYTSMGTSTGCPAGGTNYGQLRHSLMPSIFNLCLPILVRVMRVIAPSICFYE